MRTIPKGGPAFPATTLNDADENVIDPFGTLLPPGCQSAYPGMTLRDYFAARVLPEIMTAKVSWCVLDFKPFDGLTYAENTALCAYHVADAMLKARRS